MTHRWSLGWGLDRWVYTDCMSEKVHDFGCTCGTCEGWKVRVAGHEVAIPLDRSDGWIAVSERLPAANQSVIVTDGNGMWIYTYEPDHVNGWVWQERDDCQKLDAFTHWMPLPEPPITFHGTPIIWDKEAPK